MALYFSSPRIVNDQRIDFYNSDSIIKDHRFEGLVGEDKVMALYDYLTDRENGSYHFWDYSERRAYPSKKWRVYETAKLYNVYGWAICGQTAFSLLNLYTKMGFEARLMGVPGHSLCEVKYDNKWHIFDVDMWTWFRTEEGHVASAFELSVDATKLIVENENKSNPCNLPDRSLEDYASMYDSNEVGPNDLNYIVPDWIEDSHVMDFVLRPGESVTRSEVNHGCFNVPDEWLKNNIKKYIKEWSGTPRERYEPFRSIGNGLWEYKPNLTNLYSDFDLGVWENNGLRTSEHGLVGTGYASFRIQSPYIFVGKPDINMKTESASYSDGSFLEIKGSGSIKIKIDLPDGKEKIIFENLKGDFQSNLDITESVYERYELILSIGLDEGAILEKFDFSSRILTAPMGLVKLSKGKNCLYIKTKDKNNKVTTPFYDFIDFRKLEKLENRIVSSKNSMIVPNGEDWLKVALEKEGELELIFECNAPNDKFYDWANIYIGINEADQSISNPQIEVYKSIDLKNWSLIGERKISQSDLMWDCNLSCDVLMNNDKVVYFKIVSSTAVSSFYMRAHIPIDLPEDLECSVEHNWLENGIKKNFSHQISTDYYEIDCQNKPVEHSYTISCLNKKF